MAHPFVAPTIGGPCKLCGHANIFHSDGQCPTHASPDVSAAVERLKARLDSDPEFAKGLLPHMTHEQVRAMNRKRQG